MKSPVLFSKKMQKGAAFAVKQNQGGKKLSVRKRMQRLENKVQQAMSVMDVDTGKLINYKQLM